MTGVEIFLFILAIIILIIGMLLSYSGTPGGGLAALAGEDLELFRKTKDRGIIKILQIIMFIVVVVLIATGITLRLVH